ncbi:hypothetical protein Tamer19_23300 [Cupriavidus sp. TA19]|uniref:hypothetical protein n=1 Tax=Cupriavidus sp. TA19 TaxID=701108 RepID=UPI00272946E6|nr:hypothetical protein [Cupriavidus sp. TA19]GLC92922.1 hypothetical protein Tamer19_23300 [Cupriavidus sp. TA19]
MVEVPIAPYLPPPAHDGCSNLARIQPLCKGPCSYLKLQGAGVAAYAAFEHEQRLKTSAPRIPSRAGHSGNPKATTPHQKAISPLLDTGASGSIVGGLTAIRSYQYDA